MSLNRIFNCRSSVTHISSTYETENIGLIAAITTLNKLKGIDYSKLANMYQTFTEKINKLFSDNNISALCANSMGTAQIIFEDTEDAITFYRLAAIEGITFYYFDEIFFSFEHFPIFNDILDIVKIVVKKLSKIICKKGKLSLKGLHQYLVKKRIISKTFKIEDKQINKIYTKIT